MNEQQLTRSERIASRIMRSLAVVGLVSILALTAWLIVGGVRLLPYSGENLRAAVTSVTSFFTNDNSETLSFVPTSNTLAHGDSANLAWTYTGKNTAEEFAFAYNCVEGVTLSVFADAGWSDLACNTPMTVRDTTLTVIPTATKTRFNDVTLTVAKGDVTDTRTITVINSDLESALPPSKTDVPVTQPVKETPVVVAPSTPIASIPVRPTTPAQSAVRPIVKTPADLAVAIQATGVLTNVAGRSTFFPVDPIPSNKTAGVKFTVTNVGGTRSGYFTFVANLPTEGDTDYRYVSKVQNPLEPGAQIEFTLGFDDVLDKNTGTIRVTLNPTDTADKDSNNTDSERINIR